MKTEIYNTLALDLKGKTMLFDVPEGYDVEIKDDNHIGFHKQEPTSSTPISTSNIPTNWKGLNEITGEYINSYAEICSAPEAPTTDINKNVLPYGLGQPMLAFIQLLQLRQKTWTLTDSKPVTMQEYYAIVYDLGLEKFKIIKGSNLHHPLSFKYGSIAELFMQLHIELLFAAKAVL